MMGVIASLLTLISPAPSVHFNKPSTPYRVLIALFHPPHVRERRARNEALAAWWTQCPNRVMYLIGCSASVSPRPLTNYRWSASPSAKAALRRCVWVHEPGRALKEIPGNERISQPHTQQGRPLLCEPCISRRDVGESSEIVWKAYNIPCKESAFWLS